MKIESQTVGMFVLLAGAVLVFVLPFILSQFSSSLNFTQTGQIGDTIGGITGTVISFMGAIIVYLAFQAQISNA